MEPKIKPSMVALPFQQVKNSVYDANGKCVSDGRWGNPERNAQNAALIVRAVNSHAGLVAALTALANVTGEKGMDKTVLSSLVAEARTALRAAGEEV